jgi:hypothetical protein
MQFAYKVTGEAGRLSVTQAIMSCFPSKMAFWKEPMAHMGRKLAGLQRVCRQELCVALYPAWEWPLGQTRQLLLERR